jgi:hypothetical protein
MIVAWKKAAALFSVGLLVVDQTMISKTLSSFATANRMWMHLTALALFYHNPDQYREILMRQSLLYY